MTWEDIGFLLRSKIARKIMDYISSRKTPLMPSEIAKGVDMSLKNISTRLGYLLERKMVKCLNPNEKKGRLYIITKKGKETLKIIMSREE